MVQNVPKTPRYRRGDEQLLLALANGSSIRRAAQAAGLSEMTAKRRVAEPAFKRRLVETKSQIFAQATAQLVAAGSEAARTLRKLLKSRSDMARLGAARAILDLGSSLGELEQFGQRLTELEQDRLAWAASQEEQNRQRLREQARTQNGRQTMKPSTLWGQSAPTTEPTEPPCITGFSGRPTMKLAPVEDPACDNGPSLFER